MVAHRPRAPKWWAGRIIFTDPSEIYGATMGAGNLGFGVDRVAALMAKATPSRHVQEHGTRSVCVVAGLLGDEIDCAGTIAGAPACRGLALDGVLDEGRNGDLGATRFAGYFCRDNDLAQVGGAAQPAESS